jgi:hypothetical protein
MIIFPKGEVVMYGQRFTLKDIYVEWPYSPREKL